MLLTKITLHPHLWFKIWQLSIFVSNEDFKIHALGTDLTLLTEIYDGDEKNLIKAILNFLVVIGK